MTNAERYGIIKTIQEGNKIHRKEETKMKKINTTAYWDNNFDKMFDEAIEQLEREAEERGEDK